VNLEKIHRRQEFDVGLDTLHHSLGTPFDEAIGGNLGTHPPLPRQIMPQNDP
jgi:hypothetical protein